MEINNIINKAKTQTDEFYIKGSLLALWDLLYANEIATMEDVLLGAAGLSEHYTDKKIGEWMNELPQENPVVEEENWREVTTYPDPPHTKPCADIVTWEYVISVPPAGYADGFRCKRCGWRVKQMAREGCKSLYIESIPANEFIHIPPRPMEMNIPKSN